MTHVVKLPDAAEQYRKTPRLIKKLPEEWEGGEAREVYAVVGEGEEATIDRYGDVLTRAEEDPKANPRALPVLEDFLKAKGEWGLGCPACMGAEFIRFRTDGEKWTPEDAPQSWIDHGDGSYSYTCKVSGEEVRLER